jgi:hypothetical protein
VLKREPVDSIDHLGPFKPSITYTTLQKTIFIYERYVELVMSSYMIS